MSHPLQPQIDRFDASSPLEAAWTPPASWYTEARFLRLERERVFLRSWQAAGRLDQLTRPGDYFTAQLLGNPYVVLRAQDGRIAAYFNVCRHHAAAVCGGEGNARELTCPYHGWTYDLDGKLLRAPRMGRSDLLDPERFGLIPIAAQAWGPFVFVYLGQNPPALTEQLSELEPRLASTAPEKLRFAARCIYDMKCNWKVYVDNYLDGGYHVAHLHRGLAGQLDLKSYRTEIFRRLSIQSCRSGGPGDPGAEGDFPERIGGGALYAWVYPNFMINRYGPVMDTNLVLPLSRNRTRVVFDYYFERTDGREAQEFIQKSIGASHTVQEEDVAISESVQDGLSSGAYDRGIYAPAFEAPMYHFHRLLAADLHEEARRA